jgi:D-3-phosphoglycerate dehydrogenase
LIDEAPNLKVIARAAVGIGNIDVNYATEKGILVINTPGKNTNSAAELTTGLCELC